MMHEFDPERYYTLAKAGYKYELNSLVNTLGNDFSYTSLLYFLKSKKFIDLQRKGVFRELLGRVRKNAGYDLEVYYSDVLDKPLYNYINLAAACAFFDGWTIPVSDIRRENFDGYLRYSMDLLQGTREDVARNIADRLNNSDTARVVCYLRLLGLLPVETYKMKILSLGSFVGTRDIQYMHEQPSVTVGKQPTVRNGKIIGKIAPLSFKTLPHNARDIVLIDIDPSVSQRYKQLTECSAGRVLGLNTDVLQGLDVLADAIESGDKKKRDLILLYRMEPMMLPDIDAFFGRLKKVITDKAKFILTIGAGDDDRAFANRVEKLNEIESSFLCAGFTVRRFKWCVGDSYSAQRKNPVLGIGNYCSYEIFHAEIRKSDL